MEYFNKLRFNWIDMKMAGFVGISLGVLMVKVWHIEDVNHWWWISLAVLSIFWILKSIRN